jgi:DNA-binding MarR family transcriptional regulator
MRQKMYLDKTGLFFGYPAPLVRKIFRELQGYDADVRYFTRNMKIKKTDALELVNKLIKEGYLEKSNSSNDRDLFVKPTIKGNALAMASFAPSITRQTADKKIAELIERARVVNQSNDHLYMVKRIAIFGSYLTDKDRINDIDVDIILERKFGQEIQKQKEDAFVQRAIDEGKRFGTLIERLFFSELHTRKFLEQRSRSLSMRYNDEILSQVEHKIIFELKE